MRVIAHYLDGRILKGESLDVDVRRPTCHITPAGGLRQPRVAVHLAELKALYFVRSLVGDRHHQEADALIPADPRRRGAHPVEVTFLDGERLLGLTLRHPVADEQFFLVPADPASNNVRVLVNRAAVAAITEIEESASRP
jgi:uncharacterized protein DUF6982